MTPIRDLLVGSTNIFQVQVFRSDADIDIDPALEPSDKYVPDATVTVSVSRVGGDNVITDLALAYVEDSEGYYRGEDPPNDGIVLGEKYEWTLTAVVDGKTLAPSGTVRAKRHAGADRP